MVIIESGDFLVRAMYMTRSPFQSRFINKKDNVNLSLVERTRNRGYGSEGRLAGTEMPRKIRENLKGNTGPQLCAIFVNYGKSKTKIINNKPLERPETVEGDEIERMKESKRMGWRVASSPRQKRHPSKYRESRCTQIALQKQPRRAFSILIICKHEKGFSY